MYKEKQCLVFYDQLIFFILNQFLEYFMTLLTGCATMTVIVIFKEFISIKEELLDWSWAVIS